MQNETRQDDGISEDQIQERAKLIWEFQGRPEGRDEEIRNLATLVLQREMGSRTGKLIRNEVVPHASDSESADQLVEETVPEASAQTLAFPEPAEHESRNDRFRRIAWPHLSSLLRTAQFLAGKPDVAEDLVQDAMLKAFRALDSFTDGTNAKAWLMTILRRTHIDSIRAERRRPVQVPLEVEIENEEPVELTSDELDARWQDPQQMLESIDDELLLSALRTLPSDICWTLLLVDVEQLDQQQAADILEVPVGTVKSRAYRGRRMLKGILSKALSMTGQSRVDSSGSALAG